MSIIHINAIIITLATRNDRKLPACPSFDTATDTANAGPRWGKWVERLENIYWSWQRRLLHYAGESVYDIYDAEKKDTEATIEATKKV